jgi:histidine phosphatase superfamily protein (branch 1)
VRRKFILSLIALVLLSVPSLAEGLVTIILVRHPETDTSKSSEPIVPLSEAGRQRAALLVPTFQDIKFTHLFGTHTSRTRETVAPIAAKYNLPIVQLPDPTSLYEGQPITDQTTRRAPVEPVSNALLKLPPGSVALAALNSENIFAILNRLGVPAAKDGASCALGSMCVPCTTGDCFPRSDFDRIWYLVREPGRSEPISYLEFRFGAGWQPKS